MPPGRLMQAAITLFDEQGYEATTVAEIAERAGLTQAHVLPLLRRQARGAVQRLGGARALLARGGRRRTAEATPLAVVTAGLDPVAEMFIERHAFARIRAADHRGQPGAAGARADQAPDPRRCDRGGAARARRLRDAAILAAQAGVTVFHVAFAMGPTG